MISVKRLTECTIAESVQAWNVGFEGYYFDATTTAENFLKRMVQEDLSPDYSIVAFKDAQPVGIVLHGVRHIRGKKIAWNGGTGVASELRKMGIGRLLMEESLRILQEAGVTLATLEAISENHKAIALYEKMGYRVIDQLEHLSLNGAQLDKSLGVAKSEKYVIQYTVPQLVSYLPFYKDTNPWQTQWSSAKNGEAIIVRDVEGKELGYAYYRRVFNADGEHTRTILSQCEIHPECPEPEELLKWMLAHVFGSFTDEVQRVIPNLPLQLSKLTHSVLTELGFAPTAKQVYMVKDLEGKE